MLAHTQAHCIYYEHGSFQNIIYKNIGKLNTGEAIYFSQTENQDVYMSEM